MNRKEYVAPCGEIVLFLPGESIASGWKWGDFTQTELNSINASVTGIQDIWKAPWKYDDGDDAF